MDRVLCVSMFLGRLIKDANLSEATDTPNIITIIIIVIWCGAVQLSAVKPVLSGVLFSFSPVLGEGEGGV